MSVFRALRVVPRVFHASALVTPPLLVTIWFGANDSAVYEHNPKQHVPVDEYKVRSARPGP